MANNNDDHNNDAPDNARRRFFQDLGGMTAAGLAMGGMGLGIGLLPGDADAGDYHDFGDDLPSALSGKRRQNQVFNYRKRVALRYKQADLPAQPNNGDDQRYAARLGSYTKGMPHNALGEVDAAAYDTYLQAIETGDRDLFEQVPTPGNITLRNIQNIWSMDPLGPDSHSTAIRPAPAFASAEQAGEFAELYWQALLRDVPFADYDSNADVAAACSDLSAMSDFRAPKVGGQVTPATLFRGITPGELEGPLVSQMLAMDIPYGALAVPQRILTSPPGTDYITDYADWLNQQNGFVERQKIVDPTHRYIRNGRDLGEYVGRDFLYQPYLNAALILTRKLRAPFDPGNPYLYFEHQHGHNTFGAHHLYHLVVRVANIAQKHAWYHKWAVHRRLRPEEFGGRVHNHVTGATSYPIHPDLLGSQALAETHARQGSYLLSQCYPEGVPPHPAYPAGHATIAGACATMVKAFMDESWEIPDPVVASPDGTELLPYSGAPLTVGGEMNKLAANVSIGRDHAGVHWRSDSVEGMFLGEQIAIDILRDLREGYYEAFDGFTLTRFDGTTITV